MESDEDLAGKIRLIEQGEDHHSFQDKTRLVLIAAGEKPATIIDVRNTYLSKYNERRMREMKAFYEQLGLPFKIKKRTDDHRIIASVYVGRDDNWLNRLMKADDEDNDLECGRCYGFPKTAIEAYMGERERFYGKFDVQMGHYTIVQCLFELAEEDIPHEKLDPFIQFVFSQDNFRQEFISTSLRWHNVVRRLSPKIYDQIGRDDKIPYKPTAEESEEACEVFIA
jgi:hypothetical protein